MQDHSPKPQADDAILGQWFNQEQTSKIEIFKMKEMYYGKISWLKVKHEDGKPRVDKLNPDESKRNGPLMGLSLLRRFKGDGCGYFSGGTIYDPKNGKEYSCKMTLKGKTLDVRGYVGVSLLGRTTVWTRE